MGCILAKRMEIRNSLLANFLNEGSMRRAPHESQRKEPIVSYSVPKVPRDSYLFFHNLASKQTCIGLIQSVTVNPKDTFHTILSFQGFATKGEELFIWYRIRRPTGESFAKYSVFDEHGEILHLQQQSWDHLYLRHVSGREFVLDRVSRGHLKCHSARIITPSDPEYREIRFA
jgi:hypothetical protein